MALFRCASGSSGGGATITVTYSSDFYGETVTCSHGTKTYSKVATSSGTLEFSVDEEGTWTISSMGFSDTADVVLNYPAELVSLPNGETVLPTDDIETWLACAAITDKAYTTLSQVLGDSETYNALLGESNACAYMKRSTTWSTDICASQYAMNLLGQYDTACDALLSDSTWASAIANSTYFESVLNVKVPTMTSNTTPSGEVSASSNLSGFDPWKAFANETNKWIPANTDSLGSAYVEYTFDEPVVIHMMTLKHVAAGSDKYTAFVTKLQGVNNNTPTDIKANISTPDADTDYDIFIENSTAYTAYRVVRTSNTPSGLDKGRGLQVQFYGRTPSSEKVHGANGESAYILDGGSPVTITDPSTLNAGTYTVYSTVAKNPSDLTADYSKTIRICPNTKEIVVRPDNVLYWWGYNNTVSSAGVVGHSETPTFNTADITLAGTGNNITAFLTDNKMSGTKVHLVGQSSGNVFDFLYATARTGLNPSNLANISHTESLTKGDVLTHNEITYTFSSVYIGAWSRPTGKVYALWHE